MLYVVATPIGNMEEITLRAIEVLRAVDEIAAEDTRHSLPLLKRYGISKPLVSYQKFNEQKCSEDIIRKLRDGKNIALISDAGMPLISDPGGILIKKLAENELPYTVISGACALINALVLSGMDTAKFCMLGFLPTKKSARTELLQKFAPLPCTLIFYSAPHDVLDDLAFLYSALGGRRVAVVREISKMYEEVVWIRLGEEATLTLKGEFVLVVEGCDDEGGAFLDMSIKEHYQMHLDQGLDKKEAMKKVAKERKISKSEVYGHILTD